MSGASRGGGASASEPDADGARAQRAGAQPPGRAVMAAARGIAGRPLAGPFTACFVYALRVCVPPKRWALLAIPTLGAVLLGAVSNLIDVDTAEEAFAIVSRPLFGLVVPLACLVLGDAVLGAERRSGAFVLTWLSPAPVATIVLARWLAGWLLAVAALAPAMAVSAVLAGVPEGVAPLVLATVATAGAYVALFVTVGATFHRAVLVSLGIVFLGEQLLGGVLSGVAQLSPQWLGRAVYGALGPDADDLVRRGVPSGWGAVVRLATIAAVALLLAVRRVRRLKLVTGGE